MAEKLCFGGGTYRPYKITWIFPPNEVFPYKSLKINLQEEFQTLIIYEFHVPHLKDSPIYPSGAVFAYRGIRHNGEKSKLEKPKPRYQGQLAYWAHELAITTENKGAHWVWGSEREHGRKVRRMVR